MQRIGNGQLYLFGGNLNPELGNLGVHGLFLPIMYRLAMNTFTGTSLQYSSLDENTLEIPVEDSRELYFKVRSDSRTWIPAQKKVGNRLFLEIEQDMPAGHYEIVGTEDSSIIVGNFALNVPRAEYKSEVLSLEQLADLQNRHNNLTIHEDIAGIINSEGLEEADHWPFWKWLVLLILLLIAGEWFLLKWNRKK
jgi:hypothetical protein